jgi:hypothetical protein
VASLKLGLLAFLNGVEAALRFHCFAAGTVAPLHFERHDKR